jgi:hypothetical protein
MEIQVWYGNERVNVETVKGNGGQVTWNGR